MPAPACKAAAATSSSAAADDGAQKPWLFVGLGNPGRMYKGTRHNVGFEMIDAIAEAEGISVSSKQFKAIVGKGLIGDVPVMLAKPQTFMNASGESVGQLVSYFKIPLNQLVVIYDDLDLPFAKLRLLPKGGHGGHNGMRSIIDHLKQSRNFPRLRIGTAIICFLMFSSRRMSEILFPKTVVQALDGHLRRWVLSVLFWGHSATKKRKSLR